VAAGLDDGQELFNLAAREVFPVIGHFFRFLE